MSAAGAFCPLDALGADSPLEALEAATSVVTVTATVADEDGAVTLPLAGNESLCTGLMDEDEGDDEADDDKEDEDEE